MNGRTRRLRGRSFVAWVFCTTTLTIAEVAWAGPPADAPAPDSPDRTGSAGTESLAHKHAPPGHHGSEHLTGDLLGLRPALAARGITFEAFLVADWSHNFRGGLRTRGEEFRYLFDANITLDTEPLLGLKGGKAFADFQTHDGRNGSELLTGDFQGFSNIDAPGFTALYELWYEQTLLDGRLRVKAGKIDATNEFAFVENGAEFINSSAGYSPTIVGFPTYPDPATGAVAFVAPVDWMYLGAGVFDGATQEGIRTGTRGPATFFGDPADLFLIAEAGARWSLGGGRDGRIGLGAAHHTGTFDLVDGSGRTQDGVTSVYLVLEQTLFNENPAGDGQGVGVFLQIARTEQDVFDADLHVGAGVVWTGAIPTRDADVLGLMASYVHFGDPVRSAGTIVEDHELNVQAFYKVQVTPWLALKPDVQYIANPGGTRRPDAFVGTLRLEVTF